MFEPKPRCLFFTAGYHATEDELAEAKALHAAGQFDVVLRTSLYADTGPIEATACVAGCAPALYRKVYPTHDAYATPQPPLGVVYTREGGRYVRELNGDGVPHERCLEAPQTPQYARGEKPIPNTPPIAAWKRN